METERTTGDNADSPKTEENGGCGKGCLFVCGVLLFGVVLLLYESDAIPTRLPLVKDKVMIAHFREHREEFEAVARRFRSFPDRTREAGAARPQDETETKMLLERAGLRAYEGGWPYPPSTLWLPDPYHPDSCRTAQELEKSCRDEVEQWEAAKEASEKSTKDFEAAVPFPTCELWNRLRYGVLTFIPSEESVYGSGNRTLTKRYLHFPEAPKIVEDHHGWKKLLYPYPDHKYLTVEDSLNTFSFFWYPEGSRERLRLNVCQCRPIEGEPHWFLVMCIRNVTPGYEW